MVDLLAALIYLQNNYFVATESDPTDSSSLRPVALALYRELMPAGERMLAGDR
jgi:hypothetical protein